MGWFTILKFLFNIEVLFILLILFVVIYVKCNPKKHNDFFKNIERTIKDIAGEDFNANSNIKIKPQPKINNKHEEKCREIFQRIFGCRFEKVRPDWLKNPVTGRCLELDGFNPDIYTYLGKGLAFEYDGMQHAAYVPRFHSSIDDFIYSTKKDSYKDSKCKQKGILLIRIPYYVQYHDLERFIRLKLNKEKLLSL